MSFDVGNSSNLGSIFADFIKQVRETNNRVKEHLSWEVQTWVNANMR